MIGFVYIYYIKNRSIIRSIITNVDIIHITDTINSRITYISIRLTNININGIPKYILNRLDNKSYKKSINNRIKIDTCLWKCLFI